jgi:tetratricopeptide (TPR) repeat protein
MTFYRYRFIVKDFFFCFLLLSFLACAPKQGSLMTQTSADRQISHEFDRLLNQGRKMINDRRHAKALEVLEQAGEIEPMDPKWTFERARALFAMDRFEESAIACRQSLAIDPKFYDALAMGWAARIEADGGSEGIKQSVRQEIELLLQESGNDTDALMAVFQGYIWIKDLPGQQRLILKLAGRSQFNDPEKKENIAQELFEQIIQARNDTNIQIQLMDAYIRNFPKRRSVEYIVSQMLKKKQEISSDPIDVESMIASILETFPKSRRINMGVALWLIDQEKMPAEAARLLQESLYIAETEPEDKPSHFTDDLWAEEIDKEKDLSHYLLGRAWFNVGNFAKAKTELEGVAAKNRNWGKVYHFLGMIALNENNPEEAVSGFRRALEIDEHQNEAKNYLMELLSQYRGYEGDPVGYFREQSRAVYFDDVTQTAGLDELKSHRLAWSDFDRDGFADLLIDGHRLFRNTGKGTFIEITEASGLGAYTTPTGGVWGDYDNDGYPDIFSFDHSGNHLFKNSGAGVFFDKTEIAFGPMPAFQTEAAAWGDLDNDGFLDLYTANYERPGVMRGLGAQDQLYHNNGNGTFSNISQTAGIYTDEAMCGRGVTWSDVNRDGYQDIVVANYRLDPNFLWRNNHNGTFIEQADVFGIRGQNVEGAFGHSIGAASGDLNNDGVLDLFIANLAHPRYIEFSDKNMFLINDGPPDYHYSDRLKDSGIAFEESNSDPAVADVDNDGDMDIYITSIYPGRYSHLYLNDSKGFFTDATWLSGTCVENSWGSAFADYNNDGFIDLAVASENGLRLFQNKGTPNHWIKIKIKDGNCNRHGIGAWVTVSYCGHQQIREIAAGRGTGSQDDSGLIFGLGDYNGPVEISAHTLCGDNIKMKIPHPDQAITLIR